MKQTSSSLLRKMLFRITLCGILFGIGFYAWSTGITPAHSETKPGREDFGSETVEDASVVPLPVDMVEERDDKTMELSSLPTEAKETASKPSEIQVDEELRRQILEVLDSNDFGISTVLSQNGIVLETVAENSVFARLGLQSGDSVSSLDGAAMNSTGQLRDLLDTLIDNKSATLALKRDGKEVILPLVLSTTDEEAGGMTGDTTTVLNGSDIEITALIKTFSKLTKRNYIIDSAVKGKVTVHLPSAVSVPEALRILDTILLLKGFTTVPVAENTWKVVSAKDARQTTIPLVRDSNEDNASDVMVTQLIRLKHISAEDSQQLLNQFVSKDGVINAFTGTNSLVLIDSEANTNRLRELVAEIDVPAIDQELTIIPILHADAGDIAEKVNEILGEEEENNSRQQALNTRNTRQRNLRNNNIARSTRNQQTTSTSASGSTVRRRSLPFKIIPDERINSIIVVADEEMTLKVRALIEQLDSELDRSGGKFYVYRLEHADAEELGEILNNLISGSTESTSNSSGGTSGSSLSSNRSNRSNNNANARQNATQARLTQALARSRELLRSRRTGQQQSTSEGRVNLEGEVSIAPDPATNSLVINASRSDYLKIKEVIDELDAKRRQVLVEATILEVSLDKEEGMGVELQGTAGLKDGGLVGQTNFGGLTNLLTNPAALTDLTIAAASTGSLTLPGGITIPSQAVLISAVSRLTNVNVLSSPTIMATDNEEAEIIVGENVPFVTSTSTDTSNINNTFNSVERQDVGITLRITPQISTGDFVVLNIFVEISNVVAGTRNDPNGPTTTVRTTETTVTVKHGQMVVTGGLLQDSVSDSTRGVPFLQDIPVLGNYFKTQSEQIEKTNLLIFITPKIIADQFDARENTKEKALPLEEHIEQFDLQPDRVDILHADSLDKVVEEMPGDPDPLPSTIRPPRYDQRPPPQGKSVIVGDAPIERNFMRRQSAPRNSSKQGDDVVDVRVAPRLPGATSQQSSSIRQEKTKKTQSSTAWKSTPRKETTTVARSASRQTEAKSSAAEIPSSMPKAAPPLSNNKPVGDTPLEAGQAETRAKLGTSLVNEPQHPKAPPVVTPAPIQAASAAKQKSLRNSVSGASPRTFVVLRQVSGPADSAEKLPFPYADGQKTVGIVVLGAMDSPTTQFFQVGRAYRYGSASGQRTFICLGRYSSRGEAGTLHGSLSDSSAWYALSAQETLSLGEQGWKRS